MSREKEYILAFFLDPQEQGEQFIKWPLHITLVPWFRSEFGTQRLWKDINAITSGIKWFPARGIARSLFGRRGDVAVTEVVSSQLHDLHRALMTIFDNDAYNMTAADHTGVNYSPHVTKKGSAELKPGHEVVVDSVYLIEAPINNPRTRTKTILARFTLIGYEAAAR